MYIHVQYYCYFVQSSSKFLFSWQIFRKYIKHRDLILEDIFASLARLPSSKRTLRSYRFAMKMNVNIFLNNWNERSKNNFALSWKETRTVHVHVKWHMFIHRNMIRCVTSIIVVFSCTADVVVPFYSLVQFDIFHYTGVW